jgi:hypothetical protein
MTVWLIEMKCLKCGRGANSKENPKTTREIQKANNSYEGWLCKCGYYTALDP